jgi:hypothetical protein
MIYMFSQTSGIPGYYTQLLSRGDRFIQHSRKFLDRSKTEGIASKKIFKDVIRNATVREEYVKCGRNCMMCPHGPYYYAYWKVERKLKKKYIGKQFDEYFGLIG